MSADQTTICPDCTGAGWQHPDGPKCERCGGSGGVPSDAEVRRVSMVVRKRWDHNRYAPWLDDRSPHYGDGDHFVRLVMEELRRATAG